MMHPNIVFLVNGTKGGAMGVRARSFEERLRNDFQIHVAYRSANKIYAIFEFFWLLLRLRPALCYVLDMGFSGVLAASVYRLVSRSRVVVDTGDAIYELSRSSGTRGRVGLWLTKWLEQHALSISHRVVVRSHPHQELLARQGIEADVIPDGVDLKQFRPQPKSQLRRKYNLEGFTVVGLLGSLVWNPRWQMCYGLELIETVHLLRDRPVRGLIVGDGTGLPELKARCVALGLEDRIVFTGWIPYDDLPAYLNVMDICLSTQSNDTPGQVRTAGKVPVYLACGRFVLASDVGEAARVLPPEMLVPYHGTKDSQYPSRLADRVRWLLEHPERLRQPQVSIAIAQTHFDYDTLADRLRHTIYQVAPPGFGSEPQSLLPTPLGPQGNGRP